MSAVVYILPFLKITTLLETKMVKPTIAKCGFINLTYNISKY